MPTWMLGILIFPRRRLTMLFKSDGCEPMIEPSPIVWLKKPRQTSGIFAGRLNAMQWFWTACRKRDAGKAASNPSDSHVISRVPCHEVAMPSRLIRPGWISRQARVAWAIERCSALPPMLCLAVPAVLLQSMACCPPKSRLFLSGYIN